MHPAFGRNLSRFLRRLGAVVVASLAMLLSDGALNASRAVIISGPSASLAVTFPGESDVFFVPFSHPFKTVTVTGTAETSYSASAFSTPPESLIHHVNFLLFQGEEQHDDYDISIPANFTGLVRSDLSTFSLTKTLPVGNYGASIFTRLSFDNSVIFEADSTTRHFSVVARIPEPASVFILIVGIALLSFIRGPSRLT